MIKEDLGIDKKDILHVAFFAADKCLLIAVKHLGIPLEPKRAGNAAHSHC